MPGSCRISQDAVSQLPDVFPIPVELRQANSLVRRNKPFAANDL
jgi:hypothetical protein